MERRKTALVLGATGGIGSAVAKRLMVAGWRVQALHRLGAAAASRGPAGLDWLAGDAMRPADVAAAARGTALIVHAVNPPGYRNWAGLVLPMLDSTVAAARAEGARILLPGTVYNYGPDALPVLRETSPQAPRTRKGAIRVEMERRLRDAAEADRAAGPGRGVRALVVRAGDFFGPGAGNSWFAQLVRPGRPVRAVTYPGRPGVGHAWAYLPDLADAMVRLIEREDALDRFETFHFAGHWDEDGAAMAGAIRRVVGNPALPVRGFSWPVVVAASPFVTLCRELLEMRYLWREPVRLDNARLATCLGAEPHTPLDEAVRTTLAGLGCLAA